MECSRIESVEAPVSDALIVICEKCGLKLSSSDENMSRKIQKELKGLCREAFAKKTVRPVVSSCLDICPKDRIAFGFLWQNNSVENKFFTISPKDTEKDANQILETFRSTKN